MKALKTPAWLLAAMTLVLPVHQLRAADTDDDGITDVIEDQLGLPRRVKQKLAHVDGSPDRKFSLELSKKHAPDILTLEACHVGGQRVLFKTTFAGDPDFSGATFILYVDLDNDPNTGRVNKHHGGVDLMVVLSNLKIGKSEHNPSFERKIRYRGLLDGNTLWLMFDAPLIVKDGAVELGVHLLSQRKIKGASGDSTKHKIVRLPLSDNTDLPQVSFKQQIGRPLPEYRFYNDRVKLEKLEDKGLRAEQVAAAEPMKRGRPRPDVPFMASRKRVDGNVKLRRVRVNLLEEAGVARTTSPVRFGFPLPRGALFDLKRIRVINGQNLEVPAQFTATGFWPDDSLKWVLIEFATPLKKNESADFTVEFGSSVKQAEGPSKLRLEETADSLTVWTGNLKAQIDKAKFNLLTAVWRDRNQDGQFGQAEKVIGSSPEGIRLVDERGKVFVMSARAPERFVIEENGSQRVTVRVEGDYSASDGESYMSYITRLTFRANSSLIEIAHTHINTYIKTEFTDITSLSMPFQIEEITDGELLLPAARDAVVRKQWGGREGIRQLAQWNDLQFALDGGELLEGKTPGVVRVSGQKNSVSISFRDFWQRWPKAVDASGQTLNVALLPEQPDSSFGSDLPHYLMFPFVSGKYRFKWGMSFTERLVIDVGSAMGLDELHADINTPIVPVIPAEWYRETGALGNLAAPFEEQFKAWDSYVETAFELHMVRKAQAREYGYFNYGDWYGERGRNWGNNEYDLAHGLFIHFARTGSRDCFRWALITARHQADVDCVHAYPDPYYVGSNHQHSIGHTGTWSQVPQHATWSHRYDSHTAAANGHTWSEGMLEAWFLAGDPRPMEAALGLGEHIAWGMSRRFTRLGTHERTAGWSLLAVTALYNATGDAQYLEAAKRIVAVPLREQKFNEGGAWPHRLPRDHAGGHRKSYGNNLFLIGVLLSGMKAYHEVTKDPAVEKSIIAGARWMAKSWDPDEEGWPYSASADGKPYYGFKTSLNPLVVLPVAYAGQLSGDESLIEIAENALGAVVRGGTPSFGKSLAQKIVFTAGTMAILQNWFEAHRDDKGSEVLAGGTAGLEKYIVRTHDAKEHKVRAPDRKTFWIKLKDDTVDLQARRKPTGAKPKDWQKGAITVHDAEGNELAKETFSTDGAFQFKTELKAKVGSIFKVTVDDDQRAHWSLSRDNVSIVAQTSPGFSMADIGKARFYFHVPKGTREFQIDLVGVHAGIYGAGVLNAENRLVAYKQGANTGQVQLSWAARVLSTKGSNPALASLKVKPAPEDTGKVWGLVLWAANNIGCELKGVPPYVALSREDWFSPR